MGDVEIPHFFFLILLAPPVTALVAWWVSNRPERHPDFEPEEMTLDFGSSRDWTFRISREYFEAFVYDLRARFEGWSLNQVAALLTNVMDRRRPDWSVNYLVSIEGKTGEVLLRCLQHDGDGILCCLEVPRAFGSKVHGVVARYPIRLI